MTKDERLKNWVETLDIETLRKTLIICVDELIMGETLCFYKDTEVPYWDANGENIDGSERESDDYDF